MISKVRPNGIVARFVIVAAAGVVLYAPASLTAPQSGAPDISLDYEFFKTRVQPIYLKQRSPDHARCYTCHVRTRKGPRGFSLEPLSPGSNFWTEEQSRRNFQMISRLVVPGRLEASMFPMHPLAPEAGGLLVDDAPHSGGRQFESQNDPDFQTIAEWIRGQKAQGSSAP